MKLITFAVPCYNSAEYMRQCIESLLSGGDEVEVIVINDGSTDATKEIADEYAKKYPHIVRAVHKPNGGHGSGVNKGLELASGLYYKVVDSDDWLDENALQTLLDRIREHEAQGIAADLYVTNFVYEKVFAGERFVRRYAKNFPQGRFFGWDEVKPFRKSNVMLMHSLVYRTEKLRQSNTVLPEHTFYVDNIFAYNPLPHMRRLYYLDIDLYRYFIGRTDQSVNLVNIVSRYDQQMRVIRAMLAAYSYERIEKMSRGLKKYMKHNLSVMMILTLMFTTAGRNEINERKRALRELWQEIYREDKKMYHYLRHRSYPALINWLSFSLQGRVTLFGYHFFSRKIKCS